MLLLPAEEFAVEVEASVSKIVAQIRGSIAHELVFKVGFELVEWGSADDFSDFADGFGLAHAHFAHSRVTHNEQNGAPVDIGIVGKQLGVGHLVVVSLHVATTCCVVGLLCYLLFDTHYGIGFALRNIALFASEDE